MLLLVRDGSPFIGKVTTTSLCAQNSKHSVGMTYLHGFKTVSVAAVVEFEKNRLRKLSRH